MVTTRRKSLLESQEPEKETNYEYYDEEYDENDEEEEEEIFYEDAEEEVNDNDEQPVSMRKKSKHLVPGLRAGDQIELEYETITPEIIEDITKIYYSPKYECENLEYRHVIIPKDLYAEIPQHLKGRLLSELEWRSLGIKMSPGWKHYELHSPEPHIFLFRRPSS